MYLRCVDELEHDELAFEEGDMLRVLQVQDDGWWFGYCIDSPSTKGLFPSNYVQQQTKAPSPARGVSYKTAPRYDLDVNNNSSHDNDDQGDECGDDAWRHPGSTPRGALAVVRQLRKNPSEKSVLSRDVSPSLEQRSRVDDPVDNDVPDDSDGNDDYRYGLRRHVRQRSLLRFRPTTTSSIEEESNESNEEDEDVKDENDHQTIQRRHEYELTTRGSIYEDEDEGVNSQQCDEYVTPGREDWGDDSGNDGCEGERASRGSFAVAAGRSEQMSAVISDYQRRKKQNAAATIIAHGFRQHREYQLLQRNKRKRELRHQQETNRRRWAYQVIAEALAKKIQRKRYLELLGRQHRAAEMLRASIRRRRQQRQRQMKAAVIRIQHWYRARQGYRRWKARIERERQALRASRKKQQDLLKQQQALRQQQPQLPKPVQEPNRLRDRQTKGTIVSLKKHVSPSPSPSSSPAHSPSPPKERPRKTVMKKEAVDLISGMVKQQLDATLRERDDKMEELQRMIATLQDVVQKQTVMLTASNNQLTELRRERDDAVRAQRQASYLPTLHAPSPQQNQQVRQPHMTAAPPSRSPPKEASLPRLAPSKPGATGSSILPTGLRAPRPIAFPTKLPVLVSGRGEVSPRQKNR